MRSLITYLIIAAIFGGAAYAAYLSFAPPPKKVKRAAVSDVSTPVTVTATGASGYQEEWIPEHHLKKGKKTGTITSDAETSGAESSKEARKRKGRK